MADPTTEAITRMTWWKIPVPNLDVAMRFYGEALGWTFQPFGDDYVATLVPDGEMIGGIFKASGGELSNGSGSPSQRPISRRRSSASRRLAERC